MHKVTVHGKETMFKNVSIPLEINISKNVEINIYAGLFISRFYSFLTFKKIMKCEHFLYIDIY